MTGSTAAPTQDPHLARLNGALTAHHAAVTPLIDRIAEQDQEIATLKATLADYQGAVDATSAYIEQQTAAASADASGASAPAPASSAGASA